MKKIHITTGDSDGIGLEISLKSLLERPVQTDIQYVLWRGKGTPSDLQALLDKVKTKWSFISQNKYQENSSVSLIDIQSEKSPSEWVEEVAYICLKNPTTNALATGPLSKTLIQSHPKHSNFKGHTDLLRHISKTPQVFMCFLGQKFNVVLLTDHLPLNQITITQDLLRGAIKQILLVSTRLKWTEKAIGLVALNPHAGEQGILGTEEKKIFEPVVQEFNSKKSDTIEGPLVPDVAFQPSFHNRYSCYLCSYHDQGLIPFKMAHPKEGLHMSLGLPFVRTSVDHGTAKDIFGQNKASYSSMTLAIKKSAELMAGLGE